MASSYTVKQGDHISSIAAKFGFANFETIWQDPQNAAVRKLRADSHILLPGDTIFIPDKLEKSYYRPTGQISTFVVQRPTLMLKLVVKDFDDQPVSDTACELEIDGAVYSLKTDTQGRIQKEIPRDAQGGVLRIPDLDYEFPVKIGYLDPIDEETGWRARLINLGYHAGPLDSSDKLLLQYAIEEFQCDYKLSVTGILDDQTRAKLKQTHGG